MAVCKLIEERVLPLMTEERALLPGAEEEVASVVRREGQKLIQEIEVDEMEVDSASVLPCNLFFFEGLNACTEFL